MSKQEAEIIEGLKAIAASTSSLIPGKIKSVDIESMTCEVCDLDEFIWHNVRLQALTPSSDGVILVPEKDSDVIIGRIDNSDSFCVLVYSKIEDVHMKISGKYIVANEVENLFEITCTLLDALTQAVITTPAGPGNFATQTVEAFKDIKIRFEKLFKKE